MKKSILTSVMSKQTDVVFMWLYACIFHVRYEDQQCEESSDLEPILP